MKVSFAAQLQAVLLLYNVFIQVYFFAIRIASLWNKKAAAWVKGRKDVFERLRKEFSENEKTIWVHCSSAGEFEQGKPVIEALKKTYPQKKILVTFFSPSGFAVAKNYTHADVVTYLPLDTRKNAERFFKIVKPELVIFVKYEFWYHHLSIAAFHRVPILLISAVFRKDQVFFKWYGRFFKQMLFLFRYIFVQDKTSLELLQQNSITHCSVSGDTRFDRVIVIASECKPILAIEKKLQSRPCLVAGSTWIDDEKNLLVLAKYYAENLLLIIAPHKIEQAHLNEIKLLFPDAIFYSELSDHSATMTSNTIIIDNVGMLSQLYKYATITYVGGGFTSDGIHNILEAAVWSKPVIFGPNYIKYREATELIEQGGAFSYKEEMELRRLVGILLTNKKELRNTGEKARNYVIKNTGATNKILQFIYEKRLLTN